MVSAVNRPSGSQSPRPVPPLRSNANFDVPLDGRSMGGGTHLSPRRDPARSEERLRRSVAVLADQLALAERLLPCSCTSLRLLLREIEDNARYLAGESGRE